MLTQEITIKKTNLVYTDTTRLNKLLYNPSDLKTRLMVSLEVIQDFLMSSKSNCLGLGLFGVSQIEIDLTLCGSYKIKSLNSKYRNKPKTTDVLSFPVYESLRSNSESFMEPGPVVHLGDIFICREVALRQAKEFKITFEEEFLHLFIHGFLHLCGFDHEISKEEEELMFDLEEKLLDKISKKLRKLK